MAYLEGLSLAPVHGNAMDGHLRLIAALNLEIERADKLAGKLRAGSKEAVLLETVPGVGPILALTILAEIGDVGRFYSAKHLASYAGLVPSTRQSGTIAKHGHITKQGSARLRRAPVEAAIHAAMGPGPLKRGYLKLSKRKGAKMARVAVAGKLATYSCHMLREEKDFGSVVSFSMGDPG